MQKNEQFKPTGAFIGASWAALLIGLIAFTTGLWNSTFLLNEKGYYLAVLLFGLFSAVSLQKSIRDRIDGIPVTGIYYGICWFSMITALSMLTIGLFNATMLLSEKGFYGMSFILALFAAVTVQKNIRDVAHFAPDVVPELFKDPAKE